ncbi:MAG: hypothetical protein H6810_08790 [Phycisphaeraceae bacterium]|nr:MAG: hypothetical protein H6810_08790 [Phycisphaeraceae bacterium]
MTCDQRVPPPLAVLRPLDAARSDVAGLRGPAGLEDGSTIDILVLYTTQAADANGGPAGIESKILAGRDELNTAMTDSLVPTQFRVVHMEEVTFGQSGSMGTQLAQLRDPADGVLDDAHDLRDLYKADIVMLVISAGDVCGIANIGVGPGSTPTPENAFGVVAATCMTAPASAFAHEVGHVMGLLHGYEENPCTNGGSRFGKGYEAPDLSFQSVMGVGAAPRVLRFSNPDVEYNAQPTGVPIGDDQAADSAAALMLAAPIVAQYRDRDLNANGVEDSDEIAAGTLSDCDGNGYPDFADQDFNRNGTPDACDISNGTSLDADADGVPDEAEVPVLYVNQAAAGNQRGDSWPDAMIDLQDALALARASGDVSQIWIAGGTYLPATDGHRAQGFDLVAGVSLYGGFTGTEASIDDRIAGAAETILSGDLNQDDLPDLSNREDNTINVLFLYAQSQPITLDGLVVEHGNADFEVNCGGFMYDAGGMLVYNTDVIVNNCEFRDNTALSYAAALLINNSKSKIVNSWFHHNTAIDGVFYGVGGAYPYDGYVGAIRLNTFYNGADNQFVNNLVEFNEDGDSTSGILIAGCEPLFANNVIAHNSTRGRYGGGALSFVLCNGVEIDNSTIAYNTAPNAITNSYQGVSNSRSQVIISNSIIWGNTVAGVPPVAQYNGSGTGASHEINNSVVEDWPGSYVGTGSTNADPLFADAANGDFSLLPGSGAIDMGDNTAVPADGPDLDGNGNTSESLPLDFAGNPRFTDDPDTADTGVGPAPVVDAGAFEYQPAAACLADLAEPFGLLDLNDVLAFISGFTTQDPIADLDSNGLFDLVDVTTFVSSFLAGCP